jgi:hypothetical protein
VVKIPFGGGILDAPSATTPSDAVVVCHPHPAFGGRMTSPLVDVLALAFAAAGFQALRFHFRGIEGSDGAATGGLLEHEDVAAAVRFLEASGAQRIALVGYSFGALMSMKAMAAGLRPAAFIGIGVPTGVVSDDAMRVGEVDRALALGAPSWLISGADDPLCDAHGLRAWVAAHPRAHVELLPGEGHVFSFAGTRTLARRCVAHLREALA